MRTMRAARLHEVGREFVIDEVAMPRARENDVVVEVKACGVIPNLRNVVRNFPTWYPFLPLPRLPAIFGLDASGVVTEVGSQVKDVRVGERVYVNPGLSCGSCPTCRRGVPTRCRSYTLMGYFGFGPGSQRMFEEYPYGGYGQYVSAPAHNVVKLPDNVTDAQGARFGYLGTAYSALLKSRLTGGESLLVLGATGTLGVGAVLLALALGATKVFAVARNVETLGKLKALAPSRIETIPTGDRTIHKRIRELTDGDGVDVVIEALGAKAPALLATDALQALAIGGRYVAIGGVAGPIPIDPHPFMALQLQYIGSLWFTAGEGEMMASMAQAGTLDLSVLEAHPYPLSEINRALDVADGPSTGFENLHVVF